MEKKINKLFRLFKDCDDNAIAGHSRLLSSSRHNQYARNDVKTNPKNATAFKFCRLGFLPQQYLFAKSNKQRRVAFTLAEVLITLGIIGIVAAMTLPTLITNSKNKELKTALNKNYSVLQQALDMYYAENGERITPANSPGSSLKSRLMKYMNVIRDCGFGWGDASLSCIVNSPNNELRSKKYKTFNAKSDIDLNYFDDGQFVLNDGSLILIENWGMPPLFVSVDVNGFNKNPNRLGQDLFMFQIMDDGRLLPMGAEGTVYSSLEYCSLTSTNSFNGAACTYSVLTDK